VDLFTSFKPSTGEVTATRRQFPLRLAYALTIHKAQGLELPAVVVDATGIFKPVGWAYLMPSMSDLTFNNFRNAQRCHFTSGDKGTAPGGQL
jgi:hypothetical protein